jgi:hypothetical protein
LFDPLKRSECRINASAALGILKFSRMAAIAEGAPLRSRMNVPGLAQVTRISTFVRKLTRERK